MNEKAIAAGTCSFATIREKRRLLIGAVCLFGQQPEIGGVSVDELFGRAMRLSSHVLHALIPPQSSASRRYNLATPPTLTTAAITHHTLVRL